MTFADDVLNSIQKAVGDRPVLLLAGASDLVTEKLRELPDAVTAWQAENRDFPIRAASALIGSAFRANLRVGELYDEITRRGEDVMTKMRGEEVVAEEDEPFVHEPFMPEPVRPPAHNAKLSSPSGKAASKEKTSPNGKVAAGKKVAASAKTSATKKTASKKTAAKKTAVKKAVAKKTAAKKTAK
ncbi:MAG TPA: hypothetical protein VK662_09105 [Acidothermaceae bacterium]|jgi:hypothetical protein|nr:hypothetical protein [Acidothermaceae bacterium]